MDVERSCECNPASLGRLSSFLCPCQDEGSLELGNTAEDGVDSGTGRNDTLSVLSSPLVAFTGIVRTFDAERCENAHLSGLLVPFYDVEYGILADSEITGDLQASVPKMGDEFLGCGMGFIVRIWLHQKVRRAALLHFFRACGDP